MKDKSTRPGRIPPNPNTAKNAFVNTAIAILDGEIDPGEIHPPTRFCIFGG